MLLLGDCNHWLKEIKDNSIDLTVTSPPYDNLRTYGGHSFDFESIARQLYRVTKVGGIVVWNVGDQTIDGDETLTGFKHAEYFKDIGFKLNDTMIIQKHAFGVPSFQRLGRYHQAFEYVFIFAKGFVKTFNPIYDKPNRDAGVKHTRKKTGIRFIISDFGMRTNVWQVNTGLHKSTVDWEVHDHPAIMNESLAKDLIKSWSNEGDLVLDPFAGSGTTLKAAHQLNRKWIGIEINPEYVALSKKRLTPYIQQQRLTCYY